MAKRQPLPDVLGDLLTEKRNSKVPSGDTYHHDAITPEDNNSSVTEHHSTSQPVLSYSAEMNQIHGRTIETASSQPQEQERYTSSKVGKTKATFYLSKEITQALEDTWLYLRKRTGKGRPASKSILVEAALRMTLEQFKKNGLDLNRDSTAVHQ